MTIKVLLINAILCLAACSGTGQTARAVAGDVVDCTAPNLGEFAAHVLPFVASVVDAATQPDGKIDWARLRGVVDQSTNGQRYEPGKPLPVGVKIIGCAFATTLAKRTTQAPTGATLAVTPIDAGVDGLRVGFEAWRTEALGGVHFKTAAGTF